MLIYYPALLIFIFLNIIIFLLNKDLYFQKFLFLPFYTISLFLFILDVYKIYNNISFEGVLNFYKNILLYLILFITFFYFNNKTCQYRLLFYNTKKIVLITKFLVWINLLITFYFLFELSSKTKTSIIDLYLKKPYYTELNLITNSLLGNILKTKIFNTILIIGLIIHKVNYKNKSFYLFLSFLLILSTQQKGDFFIIFISSLHILLFKINLNFKYLVNVITTLFISVFFIFALTYSFYKSANVEISITKKIYEYTTFPIAGSTFLKKDKEKDILNYNTFQPLYDKLNIVETLDPLNYEKYYKINNILVGNVAGFFAPFVYDFGYIGAVFFVFILIIYLSIVENLKKNIIIVVYYSILISFLDFSFFGNYFTNSIFIEQTFAFIIFYLLNSFKYPKLKLKDERNI